MRGNRTIAENAVKAAVAVLGGAKSGALHDGLTDADADLMLVINAWPDLPDVTKTGILAMVCAAGS